MKLIFINDDEETLEMDLIRYERNTQKEVCHKIDYVCDTWKLFVGRVPKLVESFLKRSYDAHIYIYFDDCDEGRIKKFFSPSVEIGDGYIKVEKLINKQY